MLSRLSHRVAELLPAILRQFGPAFVAAILAAGVLFFAATMSGVSSSAATNGESGPPGGAIAAGDVLTNGRIPLHIPTPTAAFTDPKAGTVFTRSNVTSVAGTAEADCIDAPGGAATFVQKVEVQLGDGAPWTSARFTLEDPKGCRASWQTQWTVPGNLDNATVTLRARTLTNHGGDQFLQTVPAEETVRADTVVPQIALTTPGVFSGTSFDVSWNASAQAGIREFALEWSLDGLTWQPWQSTTSGSATFGPAEPLHVQQGQAYFFRARAVDTKGHTSDYTIGVALWPVTQVFVPVVMPAN